jgi:phage-related baseplate assembly protein
MSTIDPTQLPAPAVVEPLDFEAIVAAIKADLIARYPEVADVLDLESEPLVKLLEAFAFRELLYRARVNDAARAHLLAYATATDLDHLAAMFGLTRMAGETDDRLRLRLQLRIAALAGQGTREHYELMAMTASTNVRAAFATQPVPGAVHVIAWIDKPDAATVELVRASLNADKTRMLGVVVTVGTATARPIHVAAKIWRTTNAPTNLHALLQARMVQAFADQAALGRSVARSWITTLLHTAGVAAVEYVGADAPPATSVLGPNEYPTLGTVDLIDAGVL